MQFSASLPPLCLRCRCSFIKFHKHDSADSLKPIMNEQCLPGLLAIFYKNSMLAAPRESSGQNLGVGQFGRVAFWPEFSLGEIRSSTASLSELSLGEIRSGITFWS